MNYIEKLNKLKKDSNYARNLITNNSYDSSIRWLNKKVIDYKMIYNGDNIDNITFKNFITSSIDTSFYKSGNSSLKVSTNTCIVEYRKRENPSIKFSFDSLDLSKYNRISLDIYIKSTRQKAFYYQFFIGNDKEYAHHSPALVANEWNHVIWEIEDVLRDNVHQMIISPWLMGASDEAGYDYDIYIDNIKAESVIEDYTLGWDLENRIAYSHAGYFTHLKKQAIVRYNNCNTFNVIKDDLVVLRKNIGIVTNFNITYALLDFSEISTSGEYYIEYNDIKSNVFVISNNPFESSILKSINFLRGLRCGENILGVHSACHLNCYSENDNGQRVPVFGGWHDAGDLSQFEIPTAEIASSLIDLLEVYKHDKQMYDRIKEEALVGLDWLIRTRFGDGTRALAIEYKVWRKSLTSSNDNNACGKAENGPFENALAALAFIKAYPYFTEDKEYSEYLLSLAISDYEFAKDGYHNKIYTKRWGPNIDSVVSGKLASVASLLYKYTNDKKYYDDGIYFGDIIMKCQQKTYLTDKAKIRGFFYEDVEHNWLLLYEHRGHEESPIEGIYHLYTTFKSSVKTEEWKNCLNLYSEYITSTIDYTKPYSLILGHIYILGKINIDRFTIPKSMATVEEGFKDMIEQVKGGIKLDEGIYLRIFPIAYQRKGFFATLLAKTRCLSLIALALNNKELIGICTCQLEWILGKNPFATSTMYGEGYNYHPLYVAYTPQIVGSLPVGIMTKDNIDAPYWPTRNHAVYKEIWGHTTGKFLSLLADILTYMKGINDYEER